MTLKQAISSRNAKSTICFFWRSEIAEIKLWLRNFVIASGTNYVVIETNKKWEIEQILVAIGKSTVMFKGKR